MELEKLIEYLIECSHTIIAIVVGLAVLVKRLQRRPYVQLPSEDGPNNVEEQHIVEQRSGRVMIVDWISVLISLALVILTIPHVCIESLLWLPVFGLSVALAWNSRSPPPYVAKSLICIYILLLARNDYTDFAKVLLALELYQQYRQDSYGLKVYVGQGRDVWREDEASILSRALFFWMNPLLVLGNKRPLTEDDLPDLRDSDKGMQTVGTYHRIRKLHPKSPLYLNLMRTARGPLSWQFSLSFLRAGLTLAGPFFLNRLVGWIQEGGRDVQVGWAWLLGLSVATTIAAIISGQIYFLGRRSSLRVHSILADEIYAKALRRSGLSLTSQPSPTPEPLSEKEPSGRKSPKNGKKDPKQKPGKKNEQELPATTEASVGKVVTIMSVDSERMREFTSYSHRVIVEIPFSFIFAFSALCYTIGWSAIAGVLVMALSGPVGGIAGKRLGTFQDEVMSATDKRVNAVNEMLQGIRIIKYFAWEPQFVKRIGALRKVELHKLFRLMIAYLGFNMLAGLSSLFVNFITFGTYTIVAGHSLTPQVAFTAIALLNEVNNAMVMLPYLAMEMTQLKVAYDRIVAFLAEPELDRFDDEHAEDEALTEDGNIIIHDRVIGFINGTYSYVNGETSEKPKDADAYVPRHSVEDLASTDNIASGSDEDKAPDFQLKTLNIDFPVGKLSVIAGPTGAGKSSLLLALLGEMRRESGRHFLPSVENVTFDPATNLNSGVAYVAQSAWLLNATIRDNILFGNTYEPDRYQKVIEACALIRDLQVLPGGDLTEIGEKGVNVSGGQKARISLARAAYSRASFVLLDDVLAAVDAPTARHLVNECILGWMRNRTRLLVSHAVGLTIPQADYVVYLKGGQVTAKGTPQEIVKNDNTDALFGLNLDGRLEEGSSSSSDALDPDSPTASGRPSAAMTEGQGTKLVDDEERATGSVKWQVYWTYIKAAGGFKFLVVFLLSLFLQDAAQLSYDWWFKIWAESTIVHSNSAASMAPQPLQIIYSSLDFLGRGAWSLPALSGIRGYVQPLLTIDNPDNDPYAAHSQYYYAGIYGALGVVFFAIQILQGLYFSLRALAAATHLHNVLLKRILGAPMRFFEVTPIGRILNRFSKDVKLIDQEIVWVLDAFTHQVFRALFVTGLITYVSSLFILAMIPVVGIYLYVARTYLTVSRELKRLDSTTKSPLFSQFSETLAGVTTIRAYGAEQRLVQRQRELVDDNHRPYFLLWIANRWLSVRTDLLGSAFCFCTGSAIIFGNVESGLAGLALSYALTFSQNLTWVIRMHAEMEMGMNSVERIMEYSQVEQEPPAIVDDYRPPPLWPWKGQVEVKDLSVQYAPDLPSVLSNLTFTIQGGHKVGVVGRTGAGKSTLSLAFFRIVPFQTGTIVVDGIDIARAGVRDVRERFTIIPQDPVLFSGTLRSNLDPFDEHSDHTLWEALERVHVLDSLIGNVEVTGTPAVGVPPLNVSAAPSFDVLRVTGRDGGPPLTPGGSSPVTLQSVLNLPVTESGANFSQGQRQLLCLARALLRKSKLVFLDEATASVDNETDAKIQTTLRECFVGTTVLTIAHRLRTVMDYDRVLVLDKGCVVEYASPLELATREDDQGAPGAFRQMVLETGEADELIEIARRAEEAGRASGNPTGSVCGLDQDLITMI